MLKKLMNFINLTFRNTPLQASIVEEKPTTMESLTTAMISKDAVIEKKKRGRKKKEETADK